MRTLLITLLLAGLLNAQEPVAPTTDAPVGPVRGEDVGPYNILQSWELGYRFATIGGDQDRYRSDVNYMDGIRLLSSSLSVNSRDGHARWFDELSLTTQGLGNDPYESATLRINKKRAYEYDMTWRENDYFNPGLTVADGEHLLNTTYRWQDHDLTLFPANWYRIHAGYSRVTQDGPALTTQQEFDTSGDVFPLFRDVRQEFNEYRLGGDISAHGLRLTILHRWEYFKEDTTDNQNTPVSGFLNPAPDASVLTSFARAQPYRGRTPAWFGNLFFERKLFTIDAKASYAGGRGDFTQNELALGVNRFSAAQNQQIVVTGGGARPVTTGDFNVAFLPGSRFTFLAGFSFADTRMDGDNSFAQFDDSALLLATLNYQFLGIRLITASGTARYQFSHSFNAFAGVRYTDRQVRSVEDTTSPGFPFSGIAAEQVNLLRAGNAGFNWTPIQNLQIHAEGEIGRNNYPFAPISLRNYHLVRSRVRYRRKTFTAAASYDEAYNNNSIVLTAYSSHARTYSADASWNPRGRISIDAAYSRMHLDTIGGLAFFAGPLNSASFVSGMQSVYVSNIHAGNVGLRFAAGSRVDLFAGYSITKDTGDGSTSTSAQSNPVSQLLLSVRSYPLTYQTPLLRVSWRLNEKLRFNAGYEYYGYREDFGLLGYNQGYRAHTGYTSLLWSF